MRHSLIVLILLGLVAGCGQEENPFKPIGDRNVTSDTSPSGTDTSLPGDPVDASQGQQSASGLRYHVIREGDGPNPTAANYVRVHYSGWTLDGKKFDSSVDRGEPSEFPLGGVIKGWTEGVQLMPVGSKFKFVIPADLAYGENPGGGRPGGTLIFDVELLAIVR